MYYEENLNIISKIDKNLYDFLKKINNNKEKSLEENKNNFYDILLCKDSELCDIQYFKVNIEFTAIENIFSSFKFNFSEIIKNESIIFFFEEIYFLFFLKNLEKFNNNFVFFIFNDLYFFYKILDNFSLKEINFEKCFFIFPFTKFDKINYFLNEVISKFETNLIEEKLFEKIIFFPFINFDERNFFIDKILKLVNSINSENLYKNNIYFELFNFYLIKNKKLNFNFDNCYIDEYLFRDSFFKKIIILSELINLLFIKISDKKTYEKLIKNQIFNTLNNLEYIEKTFKKLPENPPYSLALVFGAGYSVNNLDIKNLKKLQKNGAGIIVVDTVYKYFIKNGIIPDFVVILDSQFLNYYDFIFYPTNYIDKNKKKLCEIEAQNSKELFLIEISSINKAPKVFKNFNKIYFTSLLKDSDYSWVAANPLSFDIIKKLNVNKLPSYGNVTLLSLTFSLIFFDNVYLYGFDSNFDKYIYHCKETLDYNYYLYRENYQKNLLDSLTKFCLNKKIDIKIKTSFELNKNKDIFGKEFYKFENRIKINNFSLFKEDLIVEKKFDRIKFLDEYCKEIEKDKLDNFTSEIKNLKYELEKIFFVKNLDQNSIIKKLKELFNKNELFQKIIFSIYYFDKNKKNLNNLNKKDLILIRKLFFLLQK